MSDSDDTDVLLLIPPDFFVVDSSDSEDTFSENSISKRTVVNDLISHVNELENRVSEIENKEARGTYSFESSGSMHSSNSSSHLPTSANSMYGNFNNSIGNASDHPWANSDGNIHMSPSRKLTRFNSLPPTPSGSSFRSYSTTGRNYNSPIKPDSLTDSTVLSSAKSDRFLHSKPVSNRTEMAGLNYKNNKTLEDIDKFVRSLKRNDSGDLKHEKEQLLVEGLPPSPQRSRNTASDVAHLQMDEVDRLLREVEAGQRNIEATLSAQSSQVPKVTVSKPGENVGSIPNLGFGVRDHWGGVENFLHKERGTQPSNENVVPRRVSKPGELIGSVPDLGFGVREAWENSEQPKYHSTVSHSASNMPPGEAIITPKKSFILHSDSSKENSPLDKGSKPFTSRRRLDLDTLSSAGPSKRSNSFLKKDNIEEGLLSSFPSHLEFAHSDGDKKSERFKRASNFTTTPSANVDPQPVNIRPASVSEGFDASSKPLVSLGELWADQRHQELGSDNSKIHQKLEEELYRRQHCEQLVQALQAKLLEAQQRLAVAVHVDADKDAAIKKLQGAWESLAHHWRTLEDQRHSLAQQLQDEKSTSHSQLQQLQEKLDRCELELSKALDLAHGYKEQCESAERTHAAQLAQLASKMQEVDGRLASASQARADSQLREDALNKRIEKDHVKMKELQTALDAATKTLSAREAEVAVLSEEKCALQARLKEERAHIQTLTQSRDSLRTQLDEASKREQNLQKDLKNSTQLVESNKAELHDFYQGQLERVVRDKLKEFQDQLDTAESTLQRELDSRERNVAQLAARQLQHVTEKHRLEVSLLEQKHAEELRLAQLQLGESIRHVQDLQSRLMAHEKRNAALVQRLHGVMETQWREALNIISSPVEKKLEGPASKEAKFALSDTDKAWMLVQQQQQNQQSRSEHSTPSTSEEIPFGKEGQITRQSSTPTHAAGFNENPELKKYIDMLLQKTPGNPVDSLIPTQEGRNRGSESTIKTALPQGPDSTVHSQQPNSKPPWK